MNLRLTDEQEQQAQQGRPVEVIDPPTQQAYLVVARDACERGDLAGQSEAPLVGTIASIPPQLHRSQLAPVRELPMLLPLRSRTHRWVAYHGDERLGLGRTETELYQECFRRGLRRDEIYVGRLEPSDVPPWGTIPIDRSPFEVTDSAGGDAPSTAV